MDEIIKRLGLISWVTHQWREAVADILQNSCGLSDAITAYMLGWGSQERCASLNGSHETSTHYKLLLYRDQDMRFTMWLHDYKPATRRGDGYAEVPHNHRYDLCSVILSGGYESVIYDVDGVVTPKERGTFRPADILTLRHYQVHSLAAICEGTQTLFIEGPTVKNSSTVFPLDGPPRDYPDFHGLWDDLMVRLKVGI